jgi:hypothetical protein
MDTLNELCDADLRIAELEAEIARLREDSERLEWLESRRVTLNKYHGTEYGWKFVSSHNVNRLFVKDVNTIDLNDAEPRSGDIRAAIDDARGRG